MVVAALVIDKNPLALSNRRYEMHGRLSKIITHPMHR